MNGEFKLIEFNSWETNSGAEHIKPSIWLLVCDTIGQLKPANGRRCLERIGRVREAFKSSCSAVVFD